MALKNNEDGRITKVSASYLFVDHVVYDVLKTLEIMDHNRDVPGELKIFQPLTAAMTTDQKRFAIINLLDPGKNQGIGGIKPSFQTVLQIFQQFRVPLK